MASKRHKAQIHQIDFNFGQNLLLILELLAIFEESKQIWLRDFPGQLCHKLAVDWQPIRILESEIAFAGELCHGYVAYGP